MSEKLNEDLHVKYRPKALDEIIGQEPVVKSLKTLFNENLPHAFLFTGPSGTGKTTLARILAKHLDCDDYNVIEIDVATHTGVEDMRDLTDKISYKGLGLKPTKFIILDECHMLSKSAWNSLLKTVEEPPPHVYFTFCTTEPTKVPETIQTRCLPYKLELVSPKKILRRLEYVIEQESLKLADKIKEVAVYFAKGSPRRALVNLDQIKGMDNAREAIELLGKEEITTQRAEDICRLLLSQAAWQDIVACYKGFSKMGDYDAIRQQIVRHLYKHLRSATQIKTIQFYCQLMGELVTPLSRGTERNELLYRLSRVYLMIAEHKDNDSGVM